MTSISPGGNTPSSDLLALIYDNMSDGVVALDRDGRIVFCNQAMGLLTGRPVEALVGQFPDEAWGAKGPGQGRRLSSSTTQQIIFRPDGSQRVATVKSFTLPSDKSLDIAVYRDITRVISAKRALERSEKLFNAFMEHSSAATSIKDSLGRYVYVNDQLARVLGRKPGEIIGKSDIELWSQETAKRIQDSDTEVLRSGGARHLIESLPLVDGNHQWLTLRFPLELPGEGTFVCATSIDVTKQSLAEEQLSQRLALESALAMTSAILLIRDDHRIGEALGKVGQALGVDRVVLYDARDSGLSLFVLAESWIGPKATALKLDSELSLVNLPWWGERLRDDALFAVSNVQSLPEEARSEKEWFLRGEIHSFVIIPVSGIDGNTQGFLRLDVVGRSRSWPDADLKLLGMLGEMFSIHMERVEREAELLRANRELQQRLRDRTSEATEKRQYYDELRLMRSVVVNTHDSVIVTNAQPVSENSPQIVYVNAGFTKTMGYAVADVIGRSPRLLCGEDSDPQTLERIDHAMGRWDSITAELLQYRSNGEPIWVELSLFPVSDETGTYTNWVLIQRDITMRKRAEADRARALERAEQERRMESLEILAGGIAHEFNNLLVGIMGNSSLALEEAGSRSSAAPYLEQVEKAAMRAADLTRQMLSFSGQDSSSMASLDLSSSLQSLAAVLERQAFDREVRLVTNFTGKLPPISGDIGQIRELVMNLLNNAFEAVSAGGVVEIRTELRHLGPEDLEEVTPQVSLDPGEFVVLTIRDDGRGMDAEVRQRMFEPFFTTKSPGRGLGLSAVLGIVRRHGSAVRVQSEPGKGTSVDVFFSPITEKQVKPEDKTPPDPDWKGEGLVLVVDDDDFVRNVAKSILERIGFDVITAVDGQEGLEVFDQYADQLRAMVVDIKMPRMNGDVLLMNLRERGFHIPVVLSSGYADVDSGTQHILDDLSMFLAKPYRPVTLISALQRLMAKAGG